MAIFFAWPLVDLLLRSLSSQGLVSYAHPEFDLTNYKAVFADRLLLLIQWHTVVIAFWATLFTFVLAFPTAFLLSRASGKTATALLGLFLIGFWVSIIVRLFALTEVLSRNGVVNSLAGLLHVGPFDLMFNTTGTIIGMVNYLLPYMVLLLYAGMAGVDWNLIAAAKSLGATPRRAFVEIYFPLVRPGLVGAVLLIFILGLSFFLTPAVLGGPENTTVAVYIQQQVNIYSWGVASAIGIVLLALTVIGYVVALRFSGPTLLTGVGASSSKGAIAQEPLRMSVATIALGLAAAASLLLLLLPVALVPPMSIGTTGNVFFPPKGFTLHWYAQVFDGATWTAPLLKSLEVAAAVAVISTGLGLALARVVVGLRSRTLRSVITAAAFAPLITPVILLAIGEYDVQVRTGLAGTSFGLIMAHVVIAFPVAFAVLSNALSNVDASLEPAAWTLGASRTAAFWSIVVRSIIPSVAGAFVLSFMVSWDEVVIALFQTGFEKTLPVTIFAYLQAGIVPTVPAIATMLIGVVVIGFTLAWIVRSRATAARTKKASSEGAL